MIRFACALAALLLVASACRSGPPGPALLDTRNETCRSCQMVISSRSTASQVVAPGEEPLFFDDLGCLASWLRTHPTSAGAVVYVADHRTGTWVPAGRAVYSKVPTLETPMGSHLAAHADEASRRQDPYAAGASEIPAREVLGDAAGKR